MHDVSFRSELVLMNGSKIGGHLESPNRSGATMITSQMRLVPSVDVPPSSRASWLWMLLAVAPAACFVGTLLGRSVSRDEVRFVWTGDASTYKEVIEPTLEGAGARIITIAASDGSGGVEVIEMDRQTHNAWLLQVVPELGEVSSYYWSDMDYLDANAERVALRFFEKYSATYGAFDR